MTQITTVSCAAAIAACASAVLANPFANSVLSYDAGSNAAASYTTASAALGSAERFTGEGVFPGGVTPFNPAWGTDEIVSVGSGGHLALGFDATITNDASHAYGVDFIIFGNSGFILSGDGGVGANPALFGIGGEVTVEISQNGSDWVTATVTSLDLFPTLGYSDFVDPTPGAPGLIETDFTKAMDPTLQLSDLANLSLNELYAFYDGSGGGVGIDIEGTGLDSASYVRLTNNSDERFEVDAIAVVPAPMSVTMLSLAGLCATRRRRTPA